MTGTCDCCDKQDTPLNFRIAYGIETHACNECFGMDDEGAAARCIECGTNFADPPSKVCPGCEAYREHTR